MNCRYGEERTAAISSEVSLGGPATVNIRLYLMLFGFLSRLGGYVMLTMRDHGVEDYAELRDMDATDVGELAEDDRACLDEVGQYLAAADAWQRFGIWLLHKHFEPGPGEVFVERTIREPRGTETTPVRRSAFPEQGLNSTAIRFDKSVGPGVGVIGMEFAEPADFDGVSPLSDDDEAVLAGIAQRLQAHGKIERFGVRLIRNTLGLSELEMLSETFDSAQRTLYCTITEHGAMPTHTTIETNWRWRVVQGETAPIVMVECTAGCTPVGEGHDLAHTHTAKD